MKRIFFLASVLTLCAIARVQSQSVLDLPYASQAAQVKQRVGVTDITIIYHRPVVSGRKIWGGVVPMGQVWRAGANENTTIEFSTPVSIEDKPLPAGAYGLHMIPNADTWTVIFSKMAVAWGSYTYTQSEDALRVDVKPHPIEMEEALEYEFEDLKPDAVTVTMKWEKVAVPFTVEIPNVEAVMRAKIDAAIAANPNDWRIPLQVARQYAGDDKWDEALKWVDQSIKVKETFQNLSTKAQLLFSAGKKDEALAVADQAIQRGKADKVDTTNFEKRVADMKAGKM